MSQRTLGGIAVLILGGLCLAITQLGPGLGSLDDVLNPSTASSSPVAADPDMDGDYFTITGPAKVEHEDAKTGEITYCPLDRLDRATCAYGELTKRTYGRSEKDLPDPAGWGSNGDVDIPALDGVEGSTPYFGWFWNRSHLIADSLGGDPVAENLVTGTRMQNVGSTKIHGQYAGGMAHTELIARDYLQSSASDGCPLYYAATPTYHGDELVPRTVAVDIRSCDGSIDQHVEVSNTAASYAIDYSTGSFEPAP
jgi:DNA-entry nuclease